MIVSSHSFHFTLNCPLLYTLLLECRSGSACSVLYTNTVYSVHTLLPGHGKSSRPMFQKPRPLWDPNARILRTMVCFMRFYGHFEMPVLTDLVWTFSSVQLMFYFMFWFDQYRVKLKKKHWLLDERMKEWKNIRKIRVNNRKTTAEITGPSWTQTAAGLPATAERTATLGAWTSTTAVMPVATPHNWKTCCPEAFKEFI